MKIWNFFLLLRKMDDVMEGVTTPNDKREGRTVTIIR